MDKWPKDKLIEELIKSEKQGKYYQEKLRDLVKAYKSLTNEKNALDVSLRAVQNISFNKAPTDNGNEAASSENVIDIPEQKNEVVTLMNSLSVLSAEKCRMEASFQTDKKLLRQEKEKHEIYIKELEDKIKKINNETSKEIENLKSKLIIARHDKEKDQNEHSVRMRELQRFLSQEREEKENLQKSLSELSAKYEMMLNKETANGCSDADISEKLVNLQKNHMFLLESERKRVLQAENDSKELIAVHERRVASLETRVTELSHIVANYHHIRQQDQNEITKLKAHIEELYSQSHQNTETIDECSDVLKEKSEIELNSHLQSLVEKIIKYKDLISASNQYCDKPVDIHALLCEDCNQTKQLSYEYRNLEHECEQLRIKCAQNLDREATTQNLEIKIQMLQDQNDLLKHELENTMIKHEKQIDIYRKQIHELDGKYKEQISHIEEKLKAQINVLEGQLQKQRDRTLALLDEKDNEVSSLKSSFRLILTTNNQHPKEVKKKFEGFLKGDESNTDSPHILYYSHELAHKNVEITALRKTCSQLETTTRETHKEIMLLKHKHREETSTLKQEISLLKRCQSREGANLEYLKNVIVNYLLSKNASSKWLMFNAIAAVLQFTDSEIASIRNTLH